ncbi:unnamed protein product [Brassica oleracea]
MANSYTLLQNLRAGRCSNIAEVRLLRFWEAKNINKGGELISVDMLLIDENSTVVHGSIPASRQLRFKNRLSEGSVYTLSGFDVTRSSPKYRLSDAPVSVRFNAETDFEKLPATDRIIPTEHFRFRQYDQIIELANTGNQLPDVIGELCAIRSTITDRIPGAQRVMLTLRLERYRVILSVSDATGAAAFLGFDTEMSKLTHVLASEAAQIVGIGTNAHVDVVLPRPLADLVGRTYTFQLKIKDFNFTPNHQTFTISRIFPQRELAPNPTFAEEDVEVIEPAIPQSAAERSGDKDATTSNVAEESTVATESEGTEQAARKKARVE